MTKNDRLHFALWSACFGLAIFAGCSNGAGVSEQPSTDTTSNEVGGIRREAVVPDGFTTESGLTVPRGFKVNIFAQGLTNPRRIIIAPGSSPTNYDVFVAESKANRVSVLRSSNGSGKADEKFVFSTLVSQPYGLAFTNGWLYVGNTDSVVRFPYEAAGGGDPGQTSTDQPPQKITALTRGGYNQHWTRNLIFSPDNKKLYVTVGSSCNVCEESEPARAAISVMNPDGSDRRVFASGLRNPIGMAWKGGELWTVVNERDWLGDDTPPDYLTTVKDGGFYGWPYAYTGLDRTVTPDPNFGNKAPDKVKATVAPTVPVQAHSAALGVAFYPDIAFKKNPAGWHAFPGPYAGDAFLTFHGSWNRKEKTGYKVVRVDYEKGKAVAITDFVTGFLKDGRASGRPVDVQIAPDGSLLFSDDDGGKIWRVSYAP